MLWKNSIKNMANDAINKFLLASIKKGLIENEKDLTVTFVRNKYFGKKMLGDTLLLPDGYGTLPIPRAQIRLKISKETSIS